MTTSVGIKDSLNLVKKVFERVLHNDSYTGIVINSGNVLVYSKDSFEPENMVVEAISAAQDQLKVQEIAKFLDNFQKVYMVGDPPSENSKGNRKIVIFVSYRKQIDKKEESKMQRVTGLYLYYEKKVLYVDNTEEAMNDPRPDKEKYAYNQISGLKNYAIYELLKSGYNSGSYSQENLVVYGNDLSSGEVKYLAEAPKHVMDASYRRCLAFEELSFKAKEYCPDASDTVFISIPSISPVKLSKDLKDSLVGEAGVIIINNLKASDIINSDFSSDGSIRHIWTTSVEYSNNIDTNIIVSYKNDINPNIMFELIHSSYNYIIDDSNKLTMEQIIKLANTNKVVIGSNISNLDDYFYALDLMPELRDSFIQRIKYMGDLKSGEGVLVDDTIRELLLKQNYKEVDSILHKETDLKELAVTLVERANANMIEIKNSEVFVVAGDSTRKKVKKFKITKSDILNFILTDRSSYFGRKPLEILEKDRVYITIIKKYSKILDEYIYLKVKIVKSNSELDCYISKLKKPELNRKFNENYIYEEGVILNIIGDKNAGKTTMIKTILDEIYRNKKIYILDADYDIDSQELELANSVYIDRDKVNIEMVNAINPDILIINSRINYLDLYRVLQNISKKTRTYFSSNYDMLELLKIKSNELYLRSIPDFDNRRKTITI